MLNDRVFEIVKAYSIQDFAKDVAERYIKSPRGADNP